MRARVSDKIIAVVLFCALLALLVHNIAQYFPVLKDIPNLLLHGFGLGFAFVLLIKGLRLARIKAAKGDLSPAIIAAYNNMPGIKHPVRVSRLKNKHSYVMEVAPNAVTREQVMAYAANLPVALGANYTSARVTQLARGDAFRIDFGLLQQAVNADGVLVSGVTLADFPEIPTRRIVTRLGFPWGWEPIRSAQHTIYLGLGATPILHNFKSDPHIIFAGATNRGKSEFVKWVIYQKAKRPTMFVLINTVGWGTEFSQIERRPDGTLRENFIVVRSPESLIVCANTLKAMCDHRKSVLLQQQVGDASELEDKTGQQILDVMVVVDDHTGMKHEAGERSAYGQALEQIELQTTLSRKVNVYIVICPQISTLQNVPYREQCRKVAMGLPAAQMQWYLGEPRNAPTAKGSFAVGDENGIAYGVAPLVPNDVVGGRLDECLNGISQHNRLMMAKFRIGLGRVGSDGNAFEELRRRQERYLVAREKDGLLI